MTVEDFSSRQDFVSGMMVQDPVSSEWSPLLQIREASPRQKNLRNIFGLEFFLGGASSSDPHFAEKMAKWEAHRQPNILPNSLKAAQSPPEVPLHGVPEAICTKRGDLHETSVVTRFQAHSAGPGSPLGHSFGSQSRPKGVQMPLLGRL